ncbi:MAG: hypothetical protein ACTHNK_12860 [Thermomicrobiales bacterium]
MSSAVRRPALRAALCTIALIVAGVLAACSPGSSPTPTAGTLPPRPAPATPNIITPTSPLRQPLATAAATAVTLPATPTTTRPAASATPARVASPSNEFTPRLAKLTRDGCCAYPQWLNDGSGVYSYGAAGTAGGQVATWALKVQGGAHYLLSDLFGAFSPDQQLVAYPNGRETWIARLDGTPVGAVRNGAVRVFFSPQSDHVAWLAPATDVDRAPYDLEQPARVTVARVDGGDVRILPSVVRTEGLQWFPDGRRILINGRDGAGENPGLYILDTVTGTVTRIVSSRSLESVSISPDGQTIVYVATLQPDASANGIWAIDPAGGNRRKLAFSGGYRWAPDSQGLVYIPAPSSLATDELWHYRLSDGSQTALVSVRQVAFFVAGDDWELAPQGDAIVFRSAIDGAIYTLRFRP